MEQPEKQAENKPARDTKGRLLPGHTANPNGRPKGKTIKELIRQRLENNPEELNAFVDHFIRDNRDLAWQMLEGKPQQQVELDVDKDSLAELTQFLKSVAKPNENDGSASQQSSLPDSPEAVQE